MLATKDRFAVYVYKTRYTIYSLVWYYIVGFPSGGNVYFKGMLNI